ncbi:unnamed protein product [Sympodiomycopsis kandeliae]
MSGFNEDKHKSTEEMRAVLDARAEQVRQDWVKTMEARIVREELQKCRKAEGINSYYYCKPLVETYLGLLRDAKANGHKFMETGEWTREPKIL